MNKSDIKIEKYILDNIESFTMHSFSVYFLFESKNCNMVLAPFIEEIHSAMFEGEKGQIIIEIINNKKTMFEIISTKVYKILKSKIRQYIAPINEMQHEADIGKKNFNDWMKKNKSNFLKTIKQQENK